MNPKHKDKKFTRDLQQVNNIFFINILTPIHDGDGYKKFIKATLNIMEFQNMKLTYAYRNNRI